MTLFITYECLQFAYFDHMHILRWCVIILGFLNYWFYLRLFYPYYFYREQIILSTSPPWIIIEITKLALLKIKLRNQSVIRLYSYTEIKLLTIIISQDVEVGHSHKACSIWVFTRRWVIQVHQDPNVNSHGIQGNFYDGVLWQPGLSLHQDGSVGDHIIDFAL